MTRHRFIHLVLADDRMTMKPAERVSLGLLAWPAGPAYARHGRGTAAGTPDTRSRGVGYGHPFLVPFFQVSGHPG
jgi:hypothetical protein